MALKKGLIATDDNEIIILRFFELLHVSMKFKHKLKGVQRYCYLK